MLTVALGVIVQESEPPVVGQATTMLHKYSKAGSQKNYCCNINIKNYPKSISVLSPIFRRLLNPFTEASLPMSELSSTTSKRLV